MTDHATPATSTESTSTPTRSDEPLNQRITSGEADLDEFRERLTLWLAGRDEVDSDAGVEVSAVSRPESSGMSNISVLFGAAWTPAGSAERRSAQLVARMCPQDDAFPVFPVYDLQTQFDVMWVVRENTDLPVPRVRWLEQDPAVLGTPFLVMDRATGRAPVDNPPYVFDGWLLEMDPEQRRQLQRESIAVLAAIHQIPAPAELVSSLAPAPGMSALRAHVDEQRAYYEWTTREDGLTIPVIDRAFDWIEAHWPDETSPDALSWGDARIGNILYEGTRPTAVLDWEMATIAPPEVDLGWFLYFHDVFQELAVAFDFPGIPDLFKHREVIEQYEQLTGSTVRDLPFYYVYAGLRQAVILSRITRRRIHFGEQEPPPHPDEYVLHHTKLAQLIAD
ncbi:MULTISPECIES: phosphotransferase family protein [unclassified Dietzia]|uniref:phosphotransferase family protein n=1 Tax=unclassified Dietzia TaxID=2617939 RepID=UPI0015F7A7A4|nr:MULTISPECIES: phosphotransferase family protein [unclassified Dietzia]MBB1049712.1 phosphotransferase family protein [Dietzia sp. CW19]MBB1054183.1 phosphotransferase family protein [Dietzia sp. B44]MBB1057331.1 phosphotransferase family protein [Dietzia sp. B19]